MRTSFAQFPFAEDEVMGIVARDETQAFIEVKTCEEARDAAMEGWVRVYEMKLSGHREGSAQAEAHNRRNLFAAEERLQAALASLGRKQKAKAEAEVNHGLPKSWTAKRLRSMRGKRRSFAPKRKGCLMNSRPIGICGWPRGT